MTILFSIGEIGAHRVRFAPTVLRLRTQRGLSACSSMWKGKVGVNSFQLRTIGRQPNDSQKVDPFTSLTTRAAARKWIAIQRSWRNTARIQPQRSTKSHSTRLFRQVTSPDFSRLPQAVTDLSRPVHENLAAHCSGGK